MLPTKTDRRTILWVTPLLALLTAALYWPACRNGFVGYDDGDYVCNNEHVLSGLSGGLVWALSTYDTANWHPLTWLSLQLDAELYGRGAAGFHRTNVILHAASTALLFLAFHAMTGALWRSVVVAVLFAVHPLHVESVAWVSERKDALSGFFFMLTLVAYARYVVSPSVRTYVPVGVAAALGLMAKSMLMTLPMVLLLLDYWPLGRLQLGSSVSGCDTNPKRQRVPSLGGPSLALRVGVTSTEICTQKGKSLQLGRQTGAMAAPRMVRPAKKKKAAAGDEHSRLHWQLCAEKLPLFAMAAVAAWLNFVAHKEAMKAGEDFPAAARFDNALASYMAYLRQTCWPVDLAVFYPHPGSAISSTEVAAAAVLLMVITAIAVWEVRRRPYLFVGWFWFTGMLVPVIGLIQVGTQGARIGTPTCRR